jgi:hypothetical protein
MEGRVKSTRWAEVGIVLLGEKCFGRWLGSLSLGVGG